MIQHASSDGLRPPHFFSGTNFHGGDWEGRCLKLRAVVRLNEAIGLSENEHHFPVKHWHLPHLETDPCSPQSHFPLEWSIAGRPRSTSGSSWAIAAGSRQSWWRKPCEKTNISSTSMPWRFEDLLNLWFYIIYICTWHLAEITQLEWQIPISQVIRRGLSMVCRPKF